MTKNLSIALGEREPVFAPLCLEPLTARVTEQAGFQFGYLSGGALGFSYAVSEALLTMTELVDVTRRITQRSNLGIIVDSGVGFGDAVHVARAIWEFEAAGACAIELEDQVAPKRVSHHRGIEHLVETAVMTEKIEQAVAITKEAGVTFLGPYALGALATASAEEDIRTRALAEAEALLAKGCGSHNYFFYRHVMEAALKAGDWPNALHYAEALETNTEAEPLPWCTIFIDRTQALAAYAEDKGGGQAQQALELARERAQESGFAAACVMIEEALAG